MTLGELRRTPHWSASSLNQLLNICGLQWAFRRVYEMPEAHTPMNLLFGKAFHAAATAMARATDSEDVHAIFADTLADAIASADPPAPGYHDLEALTTQGQGMLTVLQENWNADTEILGLAVPFSVPFLGKPLIGEFDAVIRVGDQVIILDWKTAASRWPEGKPDRDLQATVYAYAYSKLHDEIPVVRFDIVTKAKAPRFQQLTTTRTQDDFQRLLRLGAIAERIVEQQLYAPSEQSFACKGCGFSGPCRNWHLLAA
jgi:putative RecB family exonuclease